jgi:hypothetical protein
MVSSICGAFKQRSNQTLDIKQFSFISLYLLRGVAAGVARENIAINVSHTARPSVLNGVGSVGITLSIRLVNADNGKVVSVALHAGKAAGVRALGHVDTSGGNGRAEHSDDDKRKDDVHFRFGLKR